MTSCSRGNINRRFFALLSVMILILSVLPAVSLTGTGYGATITDAKAFALQDLLSGISVDVTSTALAREGDGTNGYYSTFDRSVSMTSDITLQSVRYDVRKSETGEEKSRGKYVCTASISDKDRDSCIFRAEGLVREINVLWSTAMTDEDLRAVIASLSLLENKLSDWDSCFLTASLLGYADEIPRYDPDIRTGAIEIIRKKAESALAASAMAGETSSTVTSSFESILIDSLWQEDSARNKPAGVSSASEGSYSKTWKLGEPGPAGGIIVYDKGSSEGGWRYLELATDDLPGTYTAIKAVRNVTSSEAGAGKENTEALLSASGNVSGSAALACAKYDGGGYDDWFLPSKGEWELVYQNMYNAKSLNLQKNAYWSSTMLNSTFTYGFSYKTKKTFSDSYTKKYKVRPMRRF